MRGENALRRTDLVLPTNDLARQDADNSRNAFNRLRADAEVFRRGIKYSGRLAWSDGVRNADTQRRTESSSGVVSISNDQSRSTERDHGAALRLDWDADKHALAASVEESGHQRDASQVNGALGVNELDSPWDQNWVAWVQDEWSIGPAVTLTTGLRGESIRYAVDGMVQSHQRVLPSVAVRWEPEGEHP